MNFSAFRYLAVGSFLLLFLLVFWLISCGQQQETTPLSDEQSRKIGNASYRPTEPDTISSIEPIAMGGRLLNSDSLARPKTIALKKKPGTVTAHPNVRRAVEGRIVNISDKRLVITPGENGVPLPVQVPARGIETTARQPEPIPMDPFRMKDGTMYNIQHLGAEQGLPFVHFWTIFQDSRGYLWLGTLREGLSRYDGQSITHFTTEQGLAGNAIRSILEDRRGNLWIATADGGVSQYDGQNFTNYTTDSGMPNQSVWSMIEDRKGHLWFGTLGGAIRYDGEQFTHYTTEQGLSSDRIKAIVEDSRGHFWLGTEGGGITHFDGESFVHYTTKDGLSSDYISSIAEDDQGRLWFGTSGPRGVGSQGVMRYDAGGGEKNAVFTHFTTTEGLSDDRVMDLLWDRRGQLWIATYDGGLTRYDDSNDRFVHITTREGLLQNSIMGLAEDSSGNLWLATNGLGISHFDKRTFVYFDEENGLSNNWVTAIAEDHWGHMWFGTLYGGLLRYDGQSFRYYTEAEGLKGAITALQEDSRGNLWIGTREDGLVRYDNPEDGDHGKLTFFTTEEGLSGNQIWAIQEDRLGKLWLATGRDGVTRLEPEGSGTPYRFTHFDDERGLGLFGPGPIFEDDSGNLWFAQLGVSRYDGEELTNFTKANGLGLRGVQSIWQDDQGNIWLTGPEGFSRYGPSQGEMYFQHYPLNAPPGSFFFDQEDRAGRIWFETETSIGFIPGGTATLTQGNLDTKNFIHLRKADGLKNARFVINRSFIDSRNRYWLGTEQDGLTMLDLNTFELSSASPRIVLNSIEIEEEFVDFRRLTDTLYRNTLSFGTELTSTFDSVVPFHNYPQSLKLPHQLNHLTFSFSGIHWVAPHKVEYSYLLEELDDDWSIPKKDNKADYRNIPPGRYTFKVKARGEGMVWSEPLEYTFTVRPPWYWNFWSGTLYLLTFATVLSLLYRWRTSMQRQKLREANWLNERLQQVDKLKDQFLANTSHELRTPLQGIIGISESLYEDAEKVSAEELRENLSITISSGKRLANLVNDILDFSKLKNYDISLLRKPVNLRVLADIVLRNHAPLIRGKSVELINAIPDDLPPADGDENRLQQILYNLIGNAIKFTEQGYIKLDAAEKAGYLQISVADTGTGIPHNKQEAIFQEFEQVDGSISREFTGTGLGLSISKRLVELHGGRMWVKSDPEGSSGERGSTFFFTLPVSEEKVTTIPGAAGAGLPTRSLVTKEQPIREQYIKADNDSLTHILIVDDEPINQQVLKNHLAGQNFQLSQAMNGMEAIAMIEANPNFDLVLLDVMMPRMSGYEVCQKIRQKYLPSELPVIMITAKNQLQDIVQGLSLGANDYLSKPFYKEELLARIRTQIDLHHIFDVAGRFVPNEFLYSLNRDRLTEVVLGDFSEREVTVLFTDIRDYTALAETMTPEENFKFVNAFHGRMGPIIRAHGGFINQYLGDAIMAIFPEGPEGALQAAIAMQQCLADYNRQRTRGNRQAIRMGVGLHSGSLIMGIIGDQKRMDAATIADTVNTASRIESLTKYYGASILLSEESMKKIKAIGDFHLRYLGKVQVKGKKEPTSLYECLDGDAPAIIERKIKTIPDFDKGLRQFFDREFAQAAATFDKVWKTNPEDHTAQLFRNKSSRYSVDGVPEDWTGVEIMTFK